MLRVAVAGTRQLLMPKPIHVVARQFRLTTSLGSIESFRCTIRMLIGVTSLLRLSCRLLGQAPTPANPLQPVT